MPRRSTVRLTKSVINQARPGSFVWDAELPGFGLRVTKAGTKSFVVQFRTLTGAQGRMVVGGYPALTADEARDLARDQLALVARGKNPSVERKAARAAPTLSDLATYYLEDYAVTAGLRPRTVHDARYVLDKFALPKLGSRKVAEVGAVDIRRLHGDARVAAGVYQANRLLATLSKMFNLAVEQEHRTANPCKGIKKFHEDQRWRNFSDEEVTRILAACDRYPYQSPANAVRLLLFTGARLQEVLKADWEQFDLEAGVWEKPSAHTKQKRVHRVELDGPALNLVREMRLLDPTGRYLFPGEDAKPDPKSPTADLRRPRSDLKRLWEWIKREANLKDARRHDLRRTTASFMLDEGVSLATIGKALGQTQTSTTARYAQLRQTKQRDALRRAGERMDALRSKPKS
ncbi:MAG: tyrosine-type recombinase/integrase [Caulobacter sp.]|nr:tyrosine-type recombinase/integrase [Caulobacter sp.]